MDNRQKSDTVDDRRTAKRYAVDLPNQIVVKNQRIDCRLVDISSTGALLKSDQKATIGADVAVALPGIGEMVGKVVRVSSSHIALSFPGILAIAPVLEQASKVA